MKHVFYCGLMFAVVAIPAAARTQDATMKQMDGMKRTQKYSGCLARTDAGTFTLTHAMTSEMPAKTSKANGSMSRDSMSKDQMAKDAMAKDTMSDASMKDSMALASTSVNLEKHVGHKVIVTGVAGEPMNGMAAFTVKSLKMVASSCS